MGNVGPNSQVTVTDVIVTTPLNFDGDGFFVQEADGGEYSGIYVFAYDAAGLDVQPGDQVTISGEYNEFNGRSEIDLDDASGVQKSGSANVPDPEVVSSSEIGTGGGKAENFEGVLVRVENVTVTDPDLGFGEFEVDGVLSVDDLFFDQNDWMLPNLDDTFQSLTGPLDFTFDDFKITPRTQADLVP